MDLFLETQVRCVCHLQEVKWKVEVENQTGLKIKCLRSSNGVEYDKLEFKLCCAAEEIRLMKTIPGKPRQNDVVERMNRTLNEWQKSI